MDIKTILIIDDNEGEHFIVEEVVEEFDDGIEIINAYDGADGLKKYEALEVKPDLILLDINMPGMGGFEFLEEFERRKLNTSVIIMFTSSELEEDKKRSLSNKNVKDFIAKPLSLEDLERVIRRVNVNS